MLLFDNKSDQHDSGQRYLCESIYCGKVLDPEQLLSYYKINKDSKIIINPRLRGGWYVINCARLNFRNYFYW